MALVVDPADHACAMRPLRAGVEDLGRRLRPVEDVPGQGRSGASGLSLQTRLEAEGVLRVIARDAQRLHLVRKACLVDGFGNLLRHDRLLRVDGLLRRRQQLLPGGLRAVSAEPRVLNGADEAQFVVGELIGRQVVPGTRGLHHGLEQALRVLLWAAAPHLAVLYILAEVALNRMRRRHLLLGLVLCLGLAPCLGLAHGRVVHGRDAGHADGACACARARSEARRAEPEDHEAAGGEAGGRGAEVARASAVPAARRRSRVFVEQRHLVVGANIFGRHHAGSHRQGGASVLGRMKNGAQGGQRGP
mmetsp:Transcript_65039/g.198896  ORF Transcript_65039/g.198896 Transcript_65039/m.198896 type:complete len:304 (-) Transcript_65039:3-914(-)